MTFPTALLAALLGAVLTVLAQLLLKSAALRAGARTPLRVWTGPLGLAALALFLVVTLLNLAAYRVLPLKLGVALHPLVLVGVVAGSRVVFGEELSRTSRVGLALIAAGVAVFSLSGW